jgi:hypothetical protein
MQLPLRHKTKGYRAPNTIFSPIVSCLDFHCVHTNFMGEERSSSRSGRLVYTCDHGAVSDLPLDCLAGVALYSLQQLLDQVHVCHDHASAAVALAAKLVHRITVFVLAGCCSSADGEVVLHPSEMPSSRSLRNLSQRSPTTCICNDQSSIWGVICGRKHTLPHEKQRIGIIILSSLCQTSCKSQPKPEKTTVLRVESPLTRHFAKNHWPKS